MPRLLPSSCLHTAVYKILVLYDNICAIDFFCHTYAILNVILLVLPTNSALSSVTLSKLGYLSLTAQKDHPRFYSNQQKTGHEIQSEV